MDKAFYRQRLIFRSALLSQKAASLLSLRMQCCPTPVQIHSVIFPAPVLLPLSSPPPPPPAPLGRSAPGVLLRAVARALSPSPGAASGSLPSPVMDGRSVWQGSRGPSCGSWRRQIKGATSNVLARRATNCPEEPAETLSVSH